MSSKNQKILFILCRTQSILLWNPAGNWLPPRVIFHTSIGMYVCVQSELVFFKNSDSCIAARFWTSAFRKTLFPRPVLWVNPVVWGYLTGTLNAAHALTSTCKIIPTLPTLPLLFHSFVPCVQYNYTFNKCKCSYHFSFSTVFGLANSTLTVPLPLGIITLFSNLVWIFVWFL